MLRYPIRRQRKANDMITLADLRAMKSVIALIRLSMLANIDPITLRVRLRRNSPDLTQAESVAIIRVLRKVRITYVPLDQQTTTTACRRATVNCKACPA